MLNKQTKMLRLSALSLAVAGTMAVAPTAANAEVSASVGVANMYLWRGVDLGVAVDDDGVPTDNGGIPSVYGDLSYSNSGFYATVAGFSGDVNAGQEYDLGMGYGAEFSGVSVDLSAWTYVYPSIDQDAGEASEAILSLGFAGISLTGVKNIAGNSRYAYYTLGYSYEAFGILVGRHDGAEGNKMVHVDLSYAFNDNLTFSVSQQVDQEYPESKDPKFVIGYSLPIEM